jgi:hypothetical protein
MTLKEKLEKMLAEIEQFRNDQVSATVGMQAGLARAVHEAAAVAFSMVIGELKKILEEE